MKQLPSLLELLKAGVHFGHTTSKWHPNMEPYIFGTKRKVHIINLESTQEKLQETAKVVQDLAAHGKTILFVGTKRQAAPLIEKYAQACDMPYISNRWIGGVLTNFKTISSMARKLTKLKKDKELGELKKYTKKEQLEFDRETERLERIVGGIEQMSKLPDAVFIVDLQEEKTALREALQMNIPVIAMCDTNANPREIDYPIPANDDAVKSVDLIVGYIADAVNEGRLHPVVTEAPAATPAPDATAPAATPAPAPAAPAQA